MIQYVRTDFINGRPDGCQTFCLCLIQWRFNASKASDCVWCARGRFAILQISITTYTPLCIFAFLLKIIRISPNHNKNQSICFNWCTYANAKVSIIWGSTTFSMLLSEIRWNKFSAPDKKITLLAGLSCVMSCQCAKNPNGFFSLQLLDCWGWRCMTTRTTMQEKWWRQWRLSCHANLAKPQRFLPVAAA